MPELKDLHIDIGAKDGDEARALVRVGDVAVIAGEPVELPNGRVVSRSMDNRLGCYVALEAARLVAEAGGAPGDVVAVAARPGGDRLRRRAHGRATRLRPDLAIVVDVTHATDAPGVDEREIGRHRSARARSSTRGSTLHPRVFELLHEAAEAEEHPVHGRGLGARDGHRRRRDPPRARRRPVGLVSMPLRYMHSPVEMVQLYDVSTPRS